MSLAQTLFVVRAEGEVNSVAAMGTAIFSAILFLLAGNVQADPQPWMEKENPDELGVYTRLDSDCPTFELEALVNGVLIRSRVRPLDFTETPELYLNVIAECLEFSTRERFYSYSIDIRFAFRNSAFVHLIYESPNYGAFGHGDSDFIQEAIKDATERAITDYLQANFDL